MAVYAVILLLAAVLFAAQAVLIYKGNTNLIHDYHRTRVMDITAYGKAFGKAMGIFAGTMALSAVVALFGAEVMWCAVTVLLIGLAVGSVALFRVQKKYNGGVFE